MKAAVVKGQGEAPVYAEFADPAPNPGERIVKVAAAALTQLARGRASGAHYSASGAFPFVAGVDGVGRLEDGGRVYFLMPRAPFGAFAEQAVVAAAQCLPLPDGLDDATAAALANPGMSSWAALAERARLVAGETVLVNGATGVAGRLAVQIAKRLGAAKVIATGRNARRLDDLKALGADAVVPLSGDEPALEARLGEAFAEGVDVVVDYLWGPSAQALLQAAAKAAKPSPLRFVQVGAVTGGELALRADVLRSIPIEIMGSGLGSVPGARLMAAIRSVFAAAEPAGFKIAARAVPLSAIGEVWAQPEGADRVVFVP